MPEIEYTEECCFNYAQDMCRGKALGKCPCRCHFSEKMRAATEHDRLAAAQERIAELTAALGEIEQAPYTPSDDTETILDRVLGIARAALAGSQGGGWEPEPWCAEDRHIVLPSGEACVCGENRMELLL